MSYRTGRGRDRVGSVYRGPTARAETDVAHSARRRGPPLGTRWRDRALAVMFHSARSRAEDEANQTLVSASYRDRSCRTVQECLDKAGSEVLRIC